MKIPNPPEATSLMTTARSFGSYDLAFALADLIDNSIHAEAKNIWISFTPSSHDVIVRVRDDGKGMSKDRLIEAMRPASANPEDYREPNDLGRFGWGMKSASLSQARVVSVVSWQNGKFTGARWDLDNLADWMMDVFVGEDAKALLDSGKVSSSGTEIIWSNSDRLCDPEMNLSVDERLNDKIAHAKRQLSLIFHRYLSGEGVSKLMIHMQGMEILPTDPFMRSHPSTQTLGEEKIQMHGDGELTVQPYILPHYSKLSHEEKETLGGPEGMVRTQGFYVYRNKRLIIYGTWFRLIPHGELSQLTRVRVDLPNSLDAQWKITVDKSDAQLPVVLRRRLREVVSKFSRKSIGVQRRRGVDFQTEGRLPIWKRNIHQGRVRYLINREHPMVIQLLNECDDSSNAYAVLRLVEAYLPADGLAKDVQEDSEKIVQAITDSDEFDSILTTCMINFLRDVSGTPKLDDFLRFMRNVEPFASQWKYSESYIRKHAADTWRLGNA